MPIGIAFSGRALPGLGGHHSQVAIWRNQQYTPSSSQCSNDVLIPYTNFPALPRRVGNRFGFFISAKEHPLMDFKMLSSSYMRELGLLDIEWPRFDLSSIQWSRMPRLKIGDAVAKLPIVQGGMGVGISLSGLASAVANEGGIGVIAANSIGMLDPVYYANHKDANAVALRKEIRKARKLSSGIIGVNIMVALQDFHALLRVAIEERADMVFLGAGLPLKGIPVEDLRIAGVKVVPIVSSARAADLIFKSWLKKYEDVPDAVVVEGPKAGGHLGFAVEQIDDPDFALERILPDVVAVAKEFGEKLSRNIPVIAAGGVYTGADIYNLFELGASGVQMGTRFVATHECDADIRFKQSYVACREEDLEIIKSPVGLPGRAIKSRFLAERSSGKKINLTCAWKCLKNCDNETAPYCISLALNNARKGNLDKGFVFAGSNAFRVTDIVSVKELLQELQKQYLFARNTGTDRIKREYERNLEKLRALKEEYVRTLKNGFNSLKDEYARDFEKGVLSFCEEHATVLAKINSLKAEYVRTVENANLLKNRLCKVFEQYSLFPRYQPVEI
jgi:NAD(P)H-dependent flavin oxidoreductase YrpB (nitropropane dioxygenase family)